MFITMNIVREAFGGRKRAAPRIARGA
jgi:hypothetical protein